MIYPFAALRVCDLRPGDHVDIPAMDQMAVFIAQTNHPIWPRLQLVIWRLADGTLSMDALSATQEMQGATLDRPKTQDEKVARLRQAIGIGQ